MIDKYIYKFCDLLDIMTSWIDKLFKKNKKKDE